VAIETILRRRQRLWKSVEKRKHFDQKSYNQSTLANKKEPDGDNPLRPPSQPDSTNPNDTGVFRWYQDLMDRILPKDRTNPPK
jgi:hypothetical protein